MRISIRRRTKAEPPTHVLVNLDDLFPKHERSTRLTPTELDVLFLASVGLTNEEIGVRKGMATETAKSHLRAINRKIQAKNRAHAVAIGIREGLIS